MGPSGARAGLAGGAVSRAGGPVSGFRLLSAGFGSKLVTPVRRRQRRGPGNAGRCIRSGGEDVASSDGVIGLRPRLAGVAGFLDRFLLPLVLVVAGLGVALPDPGRRLDGGGAILITLAVLVFCTGSSVAFADIRGMRAAAGRMALVLAASTGILPLLAWLASRLVSGAALQGGVLAAG